MTDHPGHESGPDDTPENNVNNKLDSLLPVPNEDGEETPKHEQVDGPIDELLPAPGERDTSGDDASTREELEVDTTADDIDDFIPLHGEDAPTPPADEEVQDTTRCLVCNQEIGEARFCPECGTEQVPASKAVAKLAPLFIWSRSLAIRVTLSIGAILTLIALLADNGTTALIISASTLPVVLLIRLADQLGGRDRDSWIQVAMMLLVGAAVGLPIAWFSTRMVRQSWFDGGVFNFGARNFGGIAVETVGNAPFLVWLTSGLLLPLVVILAIGAAPAALRMALAMPPKESSGMMLSAGVAAGYMIGSVIVFYWPLYTELSPIMSTSEWTLTILGVTVVHHLVWVYSGAILGAVVWRYLRDATLAAIAMPAGIAIGLPLAFSLVSLAVSPAGLWAAIVVGIGFAAAAVYLHTRFLQTAIRHDLGVGT